MTNPNPSSLRMLPVLIRICIVLDILVFVFICLGLGLCNAWKLASIRSEGFQRHAELFDTEARSCLLGLS